MLEEAASSLPTPQVSYPPVGGRLLRYAMEWQTIGADDWVLKTIAEGYRLEFTDTPESSVQIRATPLPASGEKREVLLSEVASLLRKRAVYRLEEEVHQPGFSAIFFLAPKKTGDWRPIINLKPLNRFIKPKRFRMETLSFILKSDIKGSWATSIDLKDAYLHVPVHQSHHKWLRFSICGRSFSFRCLPFGLSTAPRVFTRVVTAVAAFLRRRGIRIFMYLDDWLILGSTRQEVLDHTSFVISTAERLGFLINKQKSQLVPSQHPTYLGAEVDLALGSVSPTQERVDKLIKEVSRLMSSPQASARSWLRCLGFMASMVDVVPWCRLRMRPLQLHLAQFYRQSVHPLDHSVPVPLSLHPDLRWWTSRLNLVKGVPFPALPHQVVLTTDASNLGWGGHVGSLTASGVWDDSTRRLHINALEMLAVEYSLRALLETVSDRRVLVKSDNATVVAYLNKQGGTHSPSLCRRVIDLLLWADSVGISISAVHIPGVDNKIADCLSRGRSVQPSEWSLAPQVAQKVFRILGQPLMDLFATKDNTQLPVYCTRVRDSEAYATDAMSISWEGMSAYAFPPLPLIHRVLVKATRERCTLIVIAPFWPRQPWFHLLTGLLIDLPVMLPLHPDLLTIPGSSARFHDVVGLQLTAWLLSNDATLRKGFLERLRGLWPQGGAPQPSRYTLAVSAPTTSGAREEILIRPRRL